MTHGHHPLYVFISILVAVLGSWTALDLHRRVAAHESRRRLAWLGGAALAMGLGIWSMHFIAMLGYQVGVPLRFHTGGTIASLLLAILATGVAFFLLDMAKARGKFLLAALAMGSGICLMHYIGMGSIRAPVHIAYDPLLVLLSLTIALGASAAGLAAITKGGTMSLRAAAAAGLGFAIFGMHYTAMAAARFHATGSAASSGDIDRLWLTSAVAIATLLLLALGILAAMLDRRIETIANLDARSVKERERYLRTILGHLPVAVIVADNETGLIHYANPEAVRLIGTEVVGMHWPSPGTLRALHPDGRDFVFDEYPLARTRRGQRLERAAVIYERPDGSRFHAEVNAAPVQHPDGTSSDGILSFIDVSERVAAEEALRQGSKMQALGELTGGIAHDFNNLLTPVVGGLDIIRRKVTDERMKRIAETAFSAASRGSKLTAQLLAFSRIQRLELKPTLVAPLVRSAEPLLTTTLGPSIQIDFDLDEEAPIPVLADPTQLELAILNLAINARDAMPDSGRIRICTSLSFVDADPDLSPGEYVELSVSDTGIGMAAEIAERAFDPFFTTKGPGKGTGLGLSMVYGVARQSGGIARIRSNPGEGTTVSLFLRRVQPAISGEEGGAAEKVALPVVQRLATILVVDDDADVRSFLAEGLAASGHRVRQAEGGAEALDLLQREMFDLLLLDFAMPGLNGADVAAAALRLRPGQEIIFVTGYSESSTIEHAAPNATLLRKPVAIDALNEAVQEHLARGATRAEPNQA